MRGVLIKLAKESTSVTPVKVVQAVDIVAPVAENNTRDPTDIFTNLRRRNGPPNVGGKELMIAQQVDLELKNYQDNIPSIEMTEILFPGGPRTLTNPLLWWKEHQTQVPLLSRLARRILCIPATSAPSERVFSVAGLTIVKNRASMNPDNAASLIFLHDSWDVAEKFQKNRASKNNETYNMGFQI